MTIISKTAGVLSLISAINDIHRTSLIYSLRASQKACADTFISKSIGSQKTSSLSYKDTRRKNWFARQNFPAETNELFAGISGYLYGVKNCIGRYLPNFVLSALAIIPGKDYKVLANVAAAALGVIEAADFVSSTTNINERTDYLK